LGILLQEWGAIEKNDELSIRADLNLDGEVDGVDVGVFFAAWGYICKDIP